MIHSVNHLCYSMLMLEGKEKVQVQGSEELVRALPGHRAGTVRTRERERDGNVNHRGRTYLREEALGWVLRVHCLRGPDLFPGTRVLVAREMTLPASLHKASHLVLDQCCLYS